MPIRSVAFDLFDRPRNLRFDVNALADLEDRAKAGIAQLFSEERIGLNALRLMLWAGLKHEDRTLTVERVGDMLSEYLSKGGSLEEVTQILSEAVEACGLFERADQNKEGSVAPSDPTQAGDGGQPQK